MKYYHRTPLDLLEKTKEYLPQKDVDQIAHTIQKLQNQPVSIQELQKGIDTAVILARLKLGTATILAGLAKSAADNPRLEEEVGAEAAELAHGANKLDQIKQRNRGKIDSGLLSKLLLASSKDVRMMLIKIASELCDMRFLDEANTDTRKQTAQIVLDVFVPICHKLGLHRLRWEMEDLAMKHLNPQAYSRLKQLIPKKRAEREKESQVFKHAIKKSLEKEGLHAFVIGRAKNFYRIHKKMEEKNKKLEDVKDLLAARIVCNSVEDCYAAMTILQNSFETVSDQFTDYISQPKQNGYQSIHLGIIWNNQNCEAQIRTWKMHAEAEDGLAAHWEYKKYAKDPQFDSQLSLTKQITDWLQRQGNKKIMEALRIQFDKNQVFVFTPKNEIVELAFNSTPIDFAYAVHSNLGDKCEKAKVNGKIVPLSHILENGDTVEIITSERQQPKRAWLSFVQTDKAKNKIRSILQIGQAIVKQITRKKPAISKRAAHHLFLAKCCSPLPGDDVQAIKTTKRKIIIHRKDCTNLQKVPADKKIEIGLDEFPKKPYNAEISVRAINQAGTLAKILNEFTKFQCTINSTTTTTKGNYFSCRFNVQIKNTADLEKLLEKIRKINGVQESRRA